MVPVSFRRGRTGRSVIPFVLAAVAAATAHLAGQGALVPGANVNMVRGTAFLGGDPYLQRQNEPSLAISTRNPCHLLAGANDYRTVDFPDPTPIPNEDAAPPAAPVQNPRDAWLGVFTSMDCGATWRSALLPGHPFDTSSVGLASPNRGFTAGADAVVRAGTNGLFFYSGLVFDRADNSRSQVFVARFIDNNNRERGETIEYVDAAAVDLGDPDVFVDKPWLAVDQPRAGALMCDINGQRFPAGRVYVAWSRFEGGGARVMISRSLDCGRTWQSQALSDTNVTNQGASIAIAPHDGTVYVVWRQFAREGSPATIQIATSRNGGQTFTRATVASPINAFDQAKLENRRFRTNSLPTVAADHLGRVYVAWAERGYARASGRTNPQTGDARIVMSVSSNGTTFSPRYPIDDTLRDADGLLRFGHQVMPALTYTAGKLQVIYYDFSDDFANVFNQFVDEAETPPVDPNNPNIRRRHTVDVRAAHAEPGAAPAFVPILITPNGTSPRLSNYRTIVDDDGTVRQVQFNPPNLPLFVGGTIPFIGDYIDIAGLNYVPFQGAWRHNNGNTTGPRFDGAFPSIPVFHAAWTDHRDVKPPLDGDWTLYKAPGDPFWKMPGSECVPTRAGMRNANIYTARITNGLYAGSPGNTKPLGFQRTPSGELVRDAQGNPILMQRSFVVFIQNSLPETKKYLMRIVNQPGATPGDRASFLRAPAPPYSAADLAQRPYIWLVATVPPLSTISRTVFVTSPAERAMVRVDVLEAAAAAPNGIGNDARTAPQPLANGRRATVLLNPDPTNPTIIDPDYVSTEVPVLAEETHDPEIFDPVVTAIGDVRNNAIELRNPDEANPDEANPDEANIDEETPDEANPDEANPDEANPDEANPDEANPDEANIALRNTALPDEQLTNAHVVDVQWKVRNRGNTTTSFRFSPSYSGDRTGKHFQLLVTKRYYVPAVDGITCDLGVRRTNQVLVNVSAFDPRNPDEANPDEANPDEANPDEANPDEANPDEANPDEANATFFLAPGETATATLRIYDLNTAQAPPPAVLATYEETAAAVIQSQAVNTGEAAPPRDAAGADLVAANASVSPANAAPGAGAQVSWTLANRGTEATDASSFRTRFLFSTDREISEGDTEIAVVTHTGSVPPDDPSTPAVNEGELPQTTTITIPQGAGTGPRFILVVTDSLNEVAEADEINNAAAAELIGAQALAFAGQPSNVTQGFRFSSPITVAVVPVPGVPSTVANVRLAIASGPAGSALSGTLLAPVVSGIATFTDVTLGTPGTYTLVATGVGSEGLPVFAAPAVSAPFTVVADAPPVAVADNYTVPAGGVLDMRPDTAVWVTANDTDAIRSGPGIAPPGRVLAASLVQGPQSGTLQFNANGGFLYTPNAGFNGIDFFTYRLNDGVAFGNVTTVRIAVGDGEGNAPPVTRPISITVAEDSANTPIDVIAAALDPDGDALTIVNASALNGDVVISGNVLRYTPDPDYFGSDTINYVISDGAGNAEGAVTVTVSAVNDNPVAVDDGPFTVAVNSEATTFNVLTNDSDGPDNDESLTIVRVGGASHGRVAFTASDVRYTPHRGYTGPDSFSYEISDGNGGSASALVRVNIGENTDPVAVDDSFETTEDIAIASFNVVANDSDGDDDVLTITAVTQPDNGLVTFTPGPGADTVRYEPHANFNGVDTFTYTVSDGRGGADTATVSVVVAPVNDDPVFTAALPHRMVEEGAADTIVELLDFVFDPDVETNADELTFTVSGNTNSEVVNASINGSTLTLDYGLSGTSTVTITVEDQHDGSASDGFIVNVSPSNGAPIANPDNAETLAGRPITLNVLANDTDPDRDTGGARVVAVVPFNPPGITGNNPSSIGPLAAAPNAPYLYKPGVAGVSIINTATNALVGLIETPGLSIATRRAVDAVRGLVYFSTANAVFAIDARPGSATLNQILFTRSIGASRINAMEVDSARGRLYLTSETFNQIGATSTGAYTQLTAIDANPASPTFGQIVNSIAADDTTAAALAINPVNGDIWVSTVGNDPGISWVNADFTESDDAFEGVPAYELALDPTAGRVYGLANNGRVIAVDMATRTIVANSLFTVPGLASANAIQTLRHIVADPETGRVYVRSNGAQGSTGSVFVLQPGGTTTFWTLLAQVDVGRDSGADDLAIDTTADRVITGSGIDHRVDFINTATNALDTVAQTRRAPLDLELVTSGAGRRVYADLLNGVAPFTISPVTTMIEVAVAGETGNIVVNPATHRAYVGWNDTHARIFALDRDGLVGEVPGTLSNNAGRYLVAARGDQASQVYVINHEANSTGSMNAMPGHVAVIDASGAVARTFDAGNGPFAIAVNQTTGRLHIQAAGRGGQPGGVTVIDPATSAVSQVNVSALFTTTFTRNIAVVDALGKVYVQPNVVDTNGSNLAVYTETGLVATRLPASLGATNVHLLAVNQTTRRLYVGTTNAAGVSRILVINANDDSLVTTLNLGSQSTSTLNQAYIAIDEPRGRVYIADFERDVVHVVDAETHNLLRTVNVGDGPTAIAINPLSNRIYVGSTLDSRLTFIDGATMTVRGALDLPLAPISIDVDPAENRIYAAAVRSTLPAGSGVMVIADDSTFFTHPLTVSFVSEGVNGTVAVNLDNTITFTPTAGGETGRFNYAVSDGQQQSAPALVSVFIRQPLTITTAELPSVERGEPYSVVLETANAHGVVRWTATGVLPSGLNLSSGGVLAGTPNVSGTFTFTLRAQDESSPNQVATRTYTVSVGPLAIPNVIPPIGLVGEPYSFQFVAAGASGATTWSLVSGALPAGLRLSPSGLIDGVPTEVASYPLTVRVEDESDDTATASFSILIDGQPVLLDPLVTAEVLLNYGFTPYRVGRSPVTVQLLEGTLPTPMTITPSGVISGAPMVTGQFPLRLRVTDGRNRVVEGNTTLTSAALDQVPGSGGGNATVQTFGGGRRLAQTFTAAATGLLTAVRSNQFFCGSGDRITVELRPVTGAAIAVPDDSGPPLATGTTVLNTSATNVIQLAPFVQITAGERYAIVVSTTGACEIRNVSASSSIYLWGHALESLGGPWQQIPGVGDFSIFTLIQPRAMTFLTAANNTSATAALLANGEVLITGQSQTAHIVNPSTGLARRTTNDMLRLRTGIYTSTALNDGRALIVGGSVTVNNVTQFIAETEFNAGGVFQAGPSLGTARRAHTATKLTDGRVVIAGGANAAGNIASVEIFDPAQNTFSPGGTLLGGRSNHAAVLLECPAASPGCAWGGRILMIGGGRSSGAPQAEVFDPLTGTSVAAGAMAATRNSGIAAVLLTDGRVFVVGGFSTQVGAEIYNPANNTFAAVPGSEGFLVDQPTATRVPDGSVIVAGGRGWEQFESDFRLGVFRFNPGAGTFSAAGNLQAFRVGHTATLLPDGRLLFASGFGPAASNMPTRSAEFFNPDAAETFGIATTALPNGQPGAPYPPTSIVTSGGVAPVTFTLVGDLPAGMTFTNGTFAGTPNASTEGMYFLVVRATDSSATPKVASMPYVLRIGALQIATAALPGAVLNVPYQTQLVAQGGVPPYTWSITNFNPLPAGMSFSPTGILAGTPNVLGSFSLRFRVEDSTGQTISRNLTFEITNPLQITTTALRDGVASDNYPVSMSATGGQGFRSWTIESGTLPNGLSLNINGGFTGRLLETGDFPVTIRVTDGQGRTDARAFTLHVGAFDVQRFRSSALPAIEIGPQAIAQTLTVGANGELYGIRGDFTCAPGQTFGIRIRGVDAQGRPSDTTFPELELLNQVPSPANAVHVFPGRRRYAVGTRLAVELFGAGGCHVQQTQDVGGGDVFRETSPGTYTPVSAEMSALAIGTVIDPDTTFAYGEWFASDSTATRLFCPAPGCGYPEKVLLVGNTRSLQLYDPHVHRMEVVPNFLDRWFSNHTATRLADGRVLIAGGWQRLVGQDVSAVSGAAVIFDPATRAVSPAGSMNAARTEHQAVLLNDNRVLVVGGLGPPAANGIMPGIIDAEVFNPATGQWTVVAQSIDTRWEHTVTRLECPATQPGCVWGGRVLVHGGYTDTWPVVPAELFNPATNTFAAVAGGEENRSRAQHAAAQLDNGFVFVTGGQAVGFSGVLNTTEVYDPNDGPAGTISRGPSLGSPRMAHTATRVGASLFIAGGVTRDDGQPTASIEQYDPGVGQFIGAGAMGTVRREHNAVLLGDGHIAFAGGYTSWNRLGAVSLERFDPAGAFAILTTSLPVARLAEPYDASIDVRGGDHPITLEVIDGSLPPGLAIQNNSGAFTIHGIPGATGLFEFTVRAGEAGGQTAHQRLSILVQESLDVAQSSLGATAGMPYEEQLTAFGGAGTEWTWTFEPGFGSIAPGITLTTDGRLVGTPTAGGHYSWMVRVADNATPRQEVRRRVRLNVAAVDREQPLSQPEVGIAHVSAANNLRIAQTVIAGRSGRLRSVRLRTYCASGHLTVSVYDANTAAPFLPTDQLTVEVLQGDTAPPAAWREIVFQDPVFMRAGEPYAIVINSFNGECNVDLASGVTYSGGSTWVSSWAAPQAWNPYGNPNDFAFATYVEPIEISAFGSPTVDGRHEANEWSNASRLNVVMRAGDGAPVPATVFFQNDQENLYLSIQYDRDEFDAFTATDMYFDEDMDGDPYEAGEDVLTFNSSPTGFPWFGDNHHSHASCAPNTCWENDDDRGGTSDGMSRQTYSGRAFTVEMRHPINGGDQFDLAAVLGQTIGLRLNHLIWEPNDAQYVQFPEYWESMAPWTFAGPAGTCVLTPPGLVSWWTGDAPQDVHGSNNAVVIGAVGQAPGRFGDAFSFNAGGRLEVADSATLSPHVGAGGELTVEAWINVAALPVGSRTIIGKTFDAGTREYALSLQGSIVRFDLWQAGANPQLHASVSGAGITAGTWHHVVGTFRNGRSARVYINGVLAAESTTLTGAVGDSTSPLIIGGMSFDPFVGLIDEPAVYRREMTPDQVRSLYANGKCRPPDRKYTLQVIKVGHGTITTADERINCGAACSAAYPAGSNVTLAATPHNFGGVTFTGYTGDCPGGVCTMDRDRVVFATFTTNFQPWANSQSVQTPEDVPIQITLTGGDPEGRPLTFSIHTPPQHGTLSAVNGSQVTYTPDAGFVGTDFFYFDTFDGHFRSNPAVVLVTMNAGQRAMFVRSFNTGAGNSERGEAVISTPDGGYVLGRTVRFISNDEIVVSRLTGTGARVWETRLQAAGGQNIFELIQTSDGGYALTGATGNNPFRLFIAKLDSTGNIEWQKVMGAAAGDDFLSGSIADDGAGNLYVASSIEYGGPGSNSNDIWVAKLTYAGVFTWQKWLGVAGGNEVETDLAIVGGGPMIVGHSTQGLVQGLRFHLNAEGQVLSATRLQTTTGGVIPYSVMAIPGGGYMIAGEAGTRPWVARYNADHTLVWSRDLATTFDQRPRIDNAVLNAFGTVILSGVLNSSSPTPLRWAAAFDSAGTLLFQRRYDPAGFFRSVVAPASDGGLALVGTRTGAFGDETLLIKADGFGQSGCDYGTPTAIPNGGLTLTTTAQTAATTDAAATVVSSTLATRAALTSNVVQICPVP